MKEDLELMFSENARASFSDISWPLSPLETEMVLNGIHNSKDFIQLYVVKAYGDERKVSSAGGKGCLYFAEISVKLLAFLVILM